MSEFPVSAFVDAGLKATLVLGAAGLVALALGRASAANRHFVWTLGVAAALLLPTLRVLAPRWEAPILPASIRMAAVSTSVTIDEAPRAPATATPSRVLPQPVAAAIDSGLPSSPSPAGSPQNPGRVLMAIWLLGAVAVAIPILAGAARAAWLGRSARALESANWRTLTDEVAESLALRRTVRLVRGGSHSMPMAMGLLTPAIVLPEDADEWPEARRRAVLTHEMAHVKRRDCLTQVLAQAACAVYWFHPLAWLAARRLRVERERACDDLVLRAGASGPDYADDLLHLARAARAMAPLAWAGVAMARPSQLEGRLLAILDPSLDRRGPSRFAVGAAGLLAAALLVPLAGLEPWARPALAAPAPKAAVVLLQEEPEAARATEQQAPERPAKAETPAEAPARREKAKTEAAPQRLDKVAAALAEAVHDTDAEVRQQAVFSLGQMRDPSTTPALEGALKDPEAEVRSQAAFALGQIRSESAVQALTAAVRDKDAEVRQQAVFALGQIRAESAVPALVQATKDENEEVREQAAFALGQIRSPDGMPALLEALKDASPEVRQQAAFALGQIGDARATEALSAALKDGSAEVRKQAAFALGQLIH
jgi:beta-lactamase regulating signal transducer with metallopeptidase domain